MHDEELSKNRAIQREWIAIGDILHQKKNIQTQARKVDRGGDLR